MRIAIVYDCLFPHTVGGAERWYRNLAERLAADHDVTYITRRQWEPDKGPGTSFSVIAVSPGGELYTRSGRRRIGPPLRFGFGVFWHLLRHGGRYDVVHTASFPYFSLMGAWLALRFRRRPRLIADWHEVWGRDYWIDYLGCVGGRIGYTVQLLCARMPEHSFAFSRLHATRLAEEGHRAPIVRLTGEYADERKHPEHGEADLASERPQLVVFAGRHIREKRVALVPDTIAFARKELPELRCVIFGNGPEHDRVVERCRELELGDVIELPGSVPGDEVRRTIARAACLLLPSAREGYGLVVVEALANGTPAVLVDGSDNAATELIEPGVNGYVVASSDPSAISGDLVTAIKRGSALRRSTLEWYRDHAGELSIESSLEEVEAVYRSFSARS
jgi:glycosyltransferase involved in cell wall biosynthesis